MQYITNDQTTEERVAAYEMQLTRVNSLLDHMDTLRAMATELELKRDKAASYTTKVKLNIHANTLRFALQELKDATYPRERAELERLADAVGKPMWA